MNNRNIFRIKVNANNNNNNREIRYIGNTLLALANDKD